MKRQTRVEPPAIPSVLPKLPDRALKGRFPRLKLIWVESGYKKGGFVEWVEE